MSDFKHHQYRPAITETPEIINLMKIGHKI